MVEPVYFKRKSPGPVAEYLDHFVSLVKEHPVFSGLIVLLAVTFIFWPREHKLKIPSSRGSSPDAQAALLQGEQYLRSGNGRQAYGAFQDAESCAFRDGDLSSLADAKGFLGFMETQLRRLEDARTHFSDALELRRIVGDKTALSDELQRLAIIYSQLGMQDESLSLLLESLKLKQDLDDSKGEADVLHNLSILYEVKGELARSLESLDEALQLHQDSDDSIGVARDNELRGDILCAMGQAEEGLEVLKQVEDIPETEISGNSSGATTADLKIAQTKCLLKLKEYKEAEKVIDIAASQARDHHDDTRLGLAIVIRGTIYESQGDDQASIEAYQEAVELGEKTQNTNLSVIALGILAHSQSKSGDQESASKNLEKAVALSEKLNDRQLQAVLLGHKGLVEINQQEYSDAEDDLSEAVDLFEKLRMNLRTAGDRSAFYSVMPEAYTGLALLAINDKDYQTALGWIERGRAKSLLDMLHTRDTDSTRFQASTSVLDTDEKLADLRRKQKTSTSLEYLELAWQRRMLMQKLVRTDPELASLVEAAPPDCDKIQSALDDETALIEYFHPDRMRISKDGKDELWIFVVTRDDVDLSVVSFEPGDLLQSTQDFLDEVSNPDPDEDAFKDASDSLYASLLSPITTKIKAKRLLIVPWGPLYYIPFSAIYHNGYLGQKYEVAVIPSAGVIPFLSKKARHGVLSMLAIGNPETEYDPLPGAEQEAQEVAALFPTRSVSSGKEATETFFATKNQGYDVLHLATHGYFDPVDPMSSAVLFTPDFMNDGELQVHEIYKLNLQKVSLVTLSACETGKMHLNPGEDVVGLVEGFIFAGSPSVLASLWNVDDEATRIFMNLYYRAYRSGKSKSRSLQMAQQAMIANDTLRPPCYWAAFQLFGDPN